MTKLNAMVINGTSTADLPFFCGVVRNAAPSKAKKKNKIYELEHVNGAVVQSINAYGLKEESYEFYLHGATKSQLRSFKSILGYSGSFKPADDLSITYMYIDLEMTSEPLDATNGYRVIVTFICEPFEYENEITETLGGSITNHTNAPMYPLIKITGSTSASTFLQIGSERMTFPNGINGTLSIECKHGHQNVTNSSGSPINNQVRGPFFEILPGTHAVTKGTGISVVNITKRWGWL